MSIRVAKWEKPDNIVLHWTAGKPRPVSTPLDQSKEQTIMKSSFLDSLAALVVIAMTCSVGDAAGAEVDVLDIGSRRELFVDYYLLDKLDGTDLKLQEPKPAGVAIKYDKPWEGGMSFYTTVFQVGDTYRMYYRGGSTACYAESEDGIHWTKPVLGLVEIDGSSRNNVIRKDGWAVFSVFLDTRPGVPAEERFKGNWPLREPGGGMIGYVSSDGIHWKKLSDKPLVPMEAPEDFDGQNVIFWSQAESCYVLYARHGEGGRRATFRATSKDFRHWTKRTLMTYSDTESTVPSANLYTNQTHPYFRAPHIYIALPGRIFFADTDHISHEDDIAAAGRKVISPELREFVKQNLSENLQTSTGDYSDGVLLSTRAGSTRFDFTFLESFIRPGIGLENWTTRTNYPAQGVVQTGPSEMSLYVQRDFGQRTAHLQRMTLRIDGFASVNAPYKGGEMLTKPFAFAGRELHINYSTSAAGDIRVEIQEPNGNAIPPFTLTECVPIIGDQIDRVVAWNDGSDVRRLAGQPIRLRFVMKDADLFSLCFK